MTPAVAENVQVCAKSRLRSGLPKCLGFDLRLVVKKIARHCDIRSETSCPSIR